MKDLANFLRDNPGMILEIAHTQGRFFATFSKVNDPVAHDSGENLETAIYRALFAAKYELGYEKPRISVNAAVHTWEEQAAMISYEDVCKLAGKTEDDWLTVVYSIPGNGTSGHLAKGESTVIRAGMHFTAVRTG